MQSFCIKCNEQILRLAQVYSLYRDGQTALLYGYPRLKHLQSSSKVCCTCTDWLCFIDLSQRARVRLANVEADITQCPFREKMSVFGREGKCVVWCFVVASWQLSRASYWPWPAVINRPWLVSWITHTRHGLFGSLPSPRAFEMFSR